MMQEGLKLMEIWAENPLEPYSFFKNQVAKVSE